MTIQTLTDSANLCHLAFALPVAKTLQADSRDYAFDFDEDELGGELLAPLPASLSLQSFPEAELDAFGHTFLYFLL